jgi:lipoyl synthase
VRVRWLGRVPYREAWDLQRALAARSAEDYLLLLEHPHVYTLGRNASEANVLVDPATAGAEAIRVDRGGDVTYHGPGQLVGYPIRSVGAGPHTGTAHVRDVEQVVIDALVSLGVPRSDVGRLARFPGVWVGLDEGASAAHGPRKICAIGVRTARGRTTHGFALNVHPDLSMFGHIVPCGIPDKEVTSLAREGHEVTMDEVVERILGAAAPLWGPFDDVQRVTDAPASSSRPDHSHEDGSHEGSTQGVRSNRIRSQPVAVAIGPSRSLEVRLRRAGVAPEEGLPVRARKPEWLRVRARTSDRFLGVQHDLRDLELVTVCHEAGCPNIFECWSAGTATFMINGSRCTRSCGFCQVDTARPLPLDASEPERVAEAVARMRLAHAVVTCVARDDLPDGGADAFARTIAAIRERSPGTAVEVLISDCKGDVSALAMVFDARPDVLNHNIETVARLQRAVRPSAGYARSLAVLARAKDAGLTAKSGIIVGMGESREEVLGTLADLRAVGVDLVTVGQYLRPSERHLPVARWWSPEEFESIHEAGMAMGFAHVQASPLTRSSYHAREAADRATEKPAAGPVALGA